MEWVTTTTILQRLRNFDDHDVWGRFVERFRAPVRAFVGRVGVDQRQVEDVAQEILAIVAQSIRDGKYDPSKGRLSSWLFGVAYRQAANAVRKNAIDRRRVDGRGDHTSFWQGVPAESEASSQWDVEWERARLETCLTQVRGEVTERTMQAFELVVRGGKSPDDAAAKLGMTRDAVYVAKHRVLKRLRELRQQYDQTDSAGG